MIWAFLVVQVYVRVQVPARLRPLGWVLAHVRAQVRVLVQMWVRVRVRVLVRVWVVLRSWVFVRVPARAPMASTTPSSMCMFFELGFDPPMFSSHAFC